MAIDNVIRFPITPLKSSDIFISLGKITTINKAAVNWKANMSNNVMNAKNIPWFQFEATNKEIYSIHTTWEKNKDIIGCTEKNVLKETVTIRNIKSIIVGFRLLLDSLWDIK